MTGTSPAGLPHSAISGSPRVCHSPELLAAYHGLHRLRVPRHPPHAFLRLTTYGASKVRASYRNLPIPIRRPSHGSRRGMHTASVKIPFPTNHSSAKRPRPTTHPLSFTFQTATATRLLSR